MIGSNNEWGRFERLGVDHIHYINHHALMVIFGRLSWITHPYRSTDQWLHCKILIFHIYTILDVVHTSTNILLTNYTLYSNSALLLIKVFLRDNKKIKHLCIWFGKYLLAWFYGYMLNADTSPHGMILVNSVPLFLCIIWFHGKKISSYQSLLSPHFHISFLTFFHLLFQWVRCDGASPLRLLFPTKK